jgi:hypothetical protein
MARPGLSRFSTSPEGVKVLAEDYFEAGEEHTVKWDRTDEGRLSRAVSTGTAFAHRP